MRVITVVISAITIILIIITANITIKNSLTLNKRLDSIENNQTDMEDQLKKLKDNQLTPEEHEEQLRDINFRRIIHIRKLVNADVRGGNYIARMNARLKGTPMEGKGREFYIAALDNNLPPTLPVAIAWHESGGFIYTPPGSNNFAGMKYGNPWLKKYSYALGKGPDGTYKYQKFPSKELFIVEQAKYIARLWPGVKSAYNMKGYAESNSWAAQVEAQRGLI